MTNIVSDTFHRAYLDPDETKARFAGISNEARDLVNGYAAGYNHLLAITPTSARPASCRDAQWLKPASETDILLLVAESMIQGSAARLLPAIVAAAPPGESDLPAKPTLPAPARETEPVTPPGSNGYALGRDLTANRSGILVANPHFPWDGRNRFYELHLTIPGRLDVMGATLLPFPAVLIGFNRDVAWTHTVSTGERSTLYELTLNADDPLTYEFQGRRERITEKSVAIDVSEGDGSVRTVTRRIFLSRFGPIVMAADQGLAWSRTHAYALRDAMLANTRAIDQWLRINAANSTADIKAALHDIHGTPWVNTLAADRLGNTLYADMSIVPNVPTQTSDRCRPSEAGAAIAKKTGRVVLNGSKGECDWVETPSSLQPGILPAQAMPSIERTDYVLNSNDSFWLANAEHPLAGYSSLIGDINVPQGFRTRMGFKQIRELIDAKPGHISARDLQDMIMSDRNLAAEMTLDDIIQICRDNAQENRATIAPACDVLSAWDRRDNAGSRGAVLFREIWNRIDGRPDLWSIPFNASDPMRTPRRLAAEDPRLRVTIMNAISHVASRFEGLDVPLDVPLGAVQTRQSEVGNIPLNGGPGSAGVLNLIAVGKLGQDGYANGTIGGSSYMQAVTWDEAGPICHALLTYGQSSEPTSPYYSDQTLLFLIKNWPQRPFTELEIARERRSYVHLQQ